MNEDRRAVYQQDCESFRYQDKLLWSRFQTLSVIEGAVAGTVLLSGIKGIPAIIIAFVGLIVVFLICVLAYKDHGDSKLFTTRLSKFERDSGADPIEPKRVLGMNAKTAIRVIFGILLVFNVYLIIYAFGVWH